MALSLTVVLVVIAFVTASINLITALINFHRTKDG